LAPPELDELQRRLQRRGSDDEETIQKRLEIAQRELEQAKAEGFHDKVFVNDDLEKTYKQLENYIFGLEDNSEEQTALAVGNEAAKSAEPANIEVEMVDTAAAIPEGSIVSVAKDAKAATADSAQKSVTEGGEES